MPFLPRRLRWLPILLLLAGARHAGAQATAAQRTEKALAVKQLRDSLGRKVPDDLQSDPAMEPALAFIDDPFSVAAPSYETLAELHAKLQTARDELKARETRRSSFVSDKGAPSPAMAPVQPVAPTTAVTGALANLASLPAQTQILVGVADFFVERAKDELVFAYLDVMRTRLDRQPVLDSLLPSVTHVLRRLDVMTPRGLVPTLRAAAARDFAALPDRATDTRAYPAGFLSRDPRTLALLQGAHLAVRAGRDVRQGTAPAIVVARLARLTEAELADTALRSAIVAVGVASNEYVLSAGAIVRLVEDPRSATYAVAFLAHDVVAAPGFHMKRPAATGVAAGADSVRAFMRAHRAELAALVRRIDDSQKLVERLLGQLAQADSVGGKAYAAAARGVVQLLEGAAPMLPVPPADAAAGAEVLHALAGLAAELEESVATRDYMRLVSIVSPLLASVDSSTAATGPAFTPQMFRVLALAGSIAAASDAKEVTTVLNAAAEPVGSYRAKRVATDSGRPLSFTLNGYVGVGGGAEWAAGSTERGKGASQFGASLPVGVELTLGGFGGGRATGALAGVRQLFRGIRSWGVFLPLVDVGNLANFRLQSDSLSDTPEIGFQQVFAPGLFVMLGLSGSHPFSVGVGGQYAPKLRKALERDETVSVKRLSVILGVDVPVIRF